MDRTHHEVSRKICGVETAGNHDCMPAKMKERDLRRHLLKIETLSSSRSCVGRMSWRIQRCSLNRKGNAGLRDFAGRGKCWSRTAYVPTENPGASSLSDSKKGPGHRSIKSDKKMQGARMTKGWDLSIVSEECVREKEKRRRDGWKWTKPIKGNEGDQTGVRRRRENTKKAGR